MPPSTPTTSLSPGRMALLEPANTPLKKEIYQREQATVKERYFGHTVFAAVVLATALFDYFLLSCGLLQLLTRGYLEQQWAEYGSMALILVSAARMISCAFHCICPEERAADRGGRGGGGGWRTESSSPIRKTTVLTSTPAVTGATPPATPLQHRGSGNEPGGVISPIYPIPETTYFGTPQQSPPIGLRQRRAEYRPLYGASSPARPDLSWIDDHEFGAGGGGGRGGGGGGAAAANRSALSLSSARSHSASFASGPSSPSSVGAGLVADLASSAPFQARVAALPSTKMLTSIHTQEQVDALLARSRSAAASPTAGGGGLGDKMNQSTSFYQAMLQLDGLELHPYQMSKDAAESKADPYDVVYDSKGGVHLSPRGASPAGSDDTARFRVELAAQRAAHMAALSAAGALTADGRRRRLSHHSSSSPSRSGSGEGGASSERGGGGGTGGGVGRRRRPDSHSALSETELTNAEKRLRIWIVNTIVNPLNDGIRAFNKRLETDLAALHLRIGTSTVEQITAALNAHPELVQTTLPYLMPYLRIHTNQAYLVARIASLSVGSCMADFSWASGGTQPVGDGAAGGAGAEKAITSAFSALTARLAARPWNETLPTDTQFVLALFGAYMDTRVTSCAIVQGHNVDQPFSSRYTLVAPGKPTALHQSPGAFYLHLSQLSPPQLEFVSVAVDGSATVTTRHLFRALVLFLSHAFYENDGRIDRLSLADPALNLDRVLTGY